MNPATKTSVAVVMMILTAVSSFASVNPAGPAPIPASRTLNTAAPTLVVKKTGLDRAELAKYQSLAGQSQFLAGQEAAGASNTTKIVVGIVCVGLVVVLVAGLGDLGAGMPAGPS